MAAAPAPRPDVSVLVPAFDYGRFLGACLESVLAQRDVRIEVLVGDNASEDETPEVAAAFAERDARVTHVRREANLGYAGNVNDLLRRAAGRHVLVLAADDALSRDDYLAEAVAALDGAPDASFCHAAYEEVDEGGGPKRVIRYYDQPRTLSGEDALVAMLGMRTPWISTVVVPRAVVDRVGGLDPEHEYTWDLAWFWKLALAGPVLYLPRVGAIYRQHGTSLSGSETVARKRRLQAATLRRFRPRLAHSKRLTDACDASLELLTGELPRSVDADADQRLAARLHAWKLRDAKLVVYGAGMHTRELLERHDLSELRVLAFADRDPAYAGQSLHGRPIVAPEELAALEPEVVLVSSRFYEAQIVAQLAQLLPANVEVATIYGTPVDLWDMLA